MEIFVAFLRAIPEIVWAALLGAFVTLLGVVVSNCESRRRHLAQLRHDAEQRDRERQMTWRREVYLEATEAISRGLSYLARLVDLNTSHTELSAAYQDDVAKIAKIQVVGTDKTVQAVAAFSNEFTSIYMELSFARMDLDSRQQRIQVLDRFSEKASAELDRYIELMKQLNLQGSTDRRLWEVLNQNVEFVRKQQEGYSQQRTALAVEQGKEHLAVIRSFLNQNHRLVALIPAAVFAVRDELELPLDREEYMRSFNESLERNKATLESFLDKIQQSLDG